MQIDKIEIQKKILRFRSFRTICKISLVPGGKPSARPTTGRSHVEGIKKEKHLCFSSSARNRTKSKTCYCSLLFDIVHFTISSLF